MKKTTLLLILCSPVLVFAQKGTIIPDIKPLQTTAADNSMEIKTWIIEDYLLNCLDSNKCYLIKENGINKTIPREDIYDFDYQEGFRYTLSVKAELKTPPISAFSGIYKYRVLKIISKEDASSNTPALTNSSVNSSLTPVKETLPAVEKPTVFFTGGSSEKPNLSEELEALKKQVAELKKQVEVMQLQLQLQLQLMDKK